MALVSGLDLRSALREVVDRGAAFLPRSLDESFRRRLRRELEAGPFEHFAEEFGQVRQQIDGFDIREAFDGFPAVAVLHDELTALVRAHGRAIRGLVTWMPNEAGVARYRPGSIGITPHLDGKWYRRLVAIVTVYGNARFAVCRDRAGAVVVAWEAGPGSLTLMRGPGLGALRDGRPFHTVGAPRRGERCSIALRMSTRLSGAEGQG